MSMIEQAGGMDIAQMRMATSQRADIGNISKHGSADAAAEDFEAFFISQMLDQMYVGIKTDGMFGGGQGENVFRGMLHQEYGKVVAERGGFGIADMVRSEMLKIQEDANK